MHNPNYHPAMNGLGTKFRLGTRVRGRAFAIVVVMAGLVATCRLDSQMPPSSGQRPNDNQPVETPLTKRVQDARDQTAMNEPSVKKANFEAVNMERKRQIADDSARLLKLATDLKTEVDKTSKDTLSLGVIRKAEEIEKLARTVKEKMKLTMNAN